MARLTSSQLSQVEEIIRKHTSVLGEILVGSDKPLSDLAKQLGLPPQLTSLVTTAYKYGKLSLLQGQDLTTMTTDQVNRLMRSIKLNPSQQASIDAAKTRAQTFIDNLQQKVVSTVIPAAIQSDMIMWDAIKDIIPTAMENHTPRYQVIQMLRDTTKDWNRDWHRVAQTEMWTAKLQGEAEAIVNNEHPLTNDGAGTMVYKKPAPDACPMCKKLYLEADGVTPKVFSLAQLMANGSNVGKKQADWLPVVGCVHPNCQCTMNVKPPNTDFDSSGNLIYKRK